MEEHKSLKLSDCTIKRREALTGGRGEGYSRGMIPIEKHVTPTIFTLPVVLYPAKNIKGQQISAWHAMFPANRFRISGSGKTKEEALLSLEERLILVIEKGFVV